jgi:hypothetical protein
VTDKCVDRSCTPGPEIAATACDDDNPCTSDQCNPAGGCLHSNSDGVLCKAGLCTEPGNCSGGKCVAAPKACTSQSPCHTAYCSATTGNCTTKLKGAGSSCDDGDACSLGDSCAGEVCEGKPAICETTTRAPPTANATKSPVAYLPPSPPGSAQTITSALWPINAWPGSAWAMLPMQQLHATTAEEGGRVWSSRLSIYSAPGTPPP